jgi:prepilin-type N-terminal cleavage/methylation domain-containing protein
MSPTRQSRQRGFTLVEMLVVLAIIGILVALLLPAVMMAMDSARRASIAAEIKSLNDGAEAYYAKHNDYPPNFRDYNVVMRHINKCYKNIAPNRLNEFVAAVWPGFNNTNNRPPLTAIPQIDEGEALVFWLHFTDDDSRDPFKAIRYSPMTTTPFVSQQRFGNLNEQKLDDADADGVPSYRAVNAGDTHYIYIDSRSYKYFYQADVTDPQYAAYAESGYSSGAFVRPYWSDVQGPPSPPFPAFKPMNPTTFQIICAGRDGEFGGQLDDTFKIFKNGTGYNEADRDNQTNFSEGRRLLEFLE